MRELDDQVFSDVVLREVHRRSAFGRVAGQIDRAVKSVRAPEVDLLRGPAVPRAGDGAIVARRARAVAVAASRGVAMQVPLMCSVEAAEALARRGVLSDSTATDALRTFARDGRLIALRGARRWVYPRFQLDHFDPRDPDNIICAVNRMLDAGRYPEAATSWWTLPSGSLAGRRAPVDLLGEDHEALRTFAAAYAAGADL
ncbi:hypothetical protein [Dietzia sp. CQ4]|uniref:hypothetical protein n=1 Tax=Dietzia sp. (strain CQ4) TaxID=370437 RepID=UPI0015F9FA60|nr:hypothetical protein [Dietzia sp. CQ4]